MDENFIVSRNKKKTKIKLSVLKINLEDKQENPTALGSEGYRVYVRYGLPEGQVSVPVSPVNAVNSLLVWLQQSQDISSDFSCGGEEQVFSAANSLYKICDNNKGFTDQECNSAFPQNFDGNTNWINPPRKGKGSYLQLRLKQKSQFLRLEYRPPTRLSNNIQSLVVSYDNDTSQLIELKKLD